MHKNEAYLILWLVHGGIVQVILVSSHLCTETYVKGEKASGAADALNLE